MKKVVLYKVWNPDTLFGGHSWSAESFDIPQDGITSEPYYVEIPDNFYIDETKSLSKGIFMEGDDIACGLSMSDDGLPVVVSMEGILTLNVIGRAEEV